MIKDFQTIEVVSKHAQVSAAIRQQVINKKLKPGDKLPAEPELAAQFGVSEDTIRKAKRALIQQGILVSVNRQGTFISSTAFNARIGVIIDSNILSAAESHFARRMFTLLEQTAVPGIQIRFYHGLDSSSKEEAYNLIDEILSDKVRVILIHSNNPFFWRICDERHLPYLHINKLEDKPAAILGGYSKIVQLGIDYLTQKGINDIALMGWYQHEGLPLYKAHAKRFNLPESWCCQREIDQQLIQLETIEERGYKQFRYLWQHERRPRGLIVLDDVLLKGASYAMIELGVVPKRDLEIVSHCNKGINLFIPVPFTRLEVDPTQFTSSLMKMSQQLLANPNQQLPQQEMQVKLVEV